MKQETVAPIVLVVVMTTVAVGIKILAFQNESVLVTLPQDIALWAVGILFSLAVAEPVLARARMSEFLPKPEEGEVTYRFDLVFQNDPGRVGRYLLRFTVVTGVWILVVLTSERALRAMGTKDVFSLYCFGLVAYFLASIAVGLGIHSLLEADK